MSSKLQRPRLERDHVLTGLMKGLRYERAALRHCDLLRGLVALTLSPGQWDALLQVAYDHGGVLIEVDDRERVAAVYRNHRPAEWPAGETPSRR